MGRKKKEPTKVMRIPSSLVSHVVGIIRDWRKPFDVPDRSDKELLDMIRPKRKK